MTDAQTPAIRDAAAVVLLRRDGPPRVLMGQRGRNAAFMPSKVVFPGGGMDPEDRSVAASPGLGPADRRMLTIDADPALADALPFTAIRELWEETGLRLARPGPPDFDPAPAWRAFVAPGHVPAPDRLKFVFRAVTPPGWPRRFDARFFLADAAGIAGDPDDFSAASDELSHLRWVTLDEARGLDLPEITHAVLEEVATRFEDPHAPRPAPFYLYDRFHSYLAP